MFPEVIVGPHKGLAQTHLSGLLRVNIFSGPNDSGKSTVLEALSTPELSRFGYTNGALPLDRLARELEKLKTRQGARVARSGDWLAILREAANTRPVWFAGTYAELSNAVRNCINNRPFPKDFEQAKLLESFKSTFPEIVKSQHVAAKRRLETTGTWGKSDSTATQGAGVLQALASLKNSRRDSDEFARFMTITTAFKEISGGYHFDLTVQDASVELHFSRDDTKWFQAEHCGLGLQDVLLLLYYCTIPGIEILAIEEPESHLHPDIQRRLLRHFEQLAGPQIFLSTHSNVFLSGASARVFATRYQDEHVHVADVTSRAYALADLGYSVSDNLTADAVVLVEGPSDVPVIEEFCSKIGISSKRLIRTWPLGGDIMGQLNLEVFTSAYRTFALVDNDPKSGAVRRAFEKKCAENNIPVTRLSRYAIENYFSLAALRSVFGSQVADQVTSLDANLPIDQQLGFSPKRQNRAVARTMTLAEIEGTDLRAFFGLLERELGV